MRCDNTRLIENLISFSSMLMLSINVDLEFIFSLVTLFVVCLNWSPALICYIHLNWTYARNFHAKPFLFSIVFFFTQRINLSKELSNLNNTPFRFRVWMCKVWNDIFQSIYVWHNLLHSFFSFSLFPISLKLFCE